jgi:hypothetical protein
MTTIKKHSLSYAQKALILETEQHTNENPLEVFISTPGSAPYLFLPDRDSIKLKCTGNRGINSEALYAAKVHVTD